MNFDVRSSMFEAKKNHTHLLRILSPLKRRKTTTFFTWLLFRLKFSTHSLPFYFILCDILRHTLLSFFLSLAHNLVFCSHINRYVGHHYGQKKNAYQMCTSVFYDFAIVKRKLVMMIKVLSSNVGLALIFFSLLFFEGIFGFFFLRQIDIDLKVVTKLSWKIVR